LAALIVPREARFQLGDHQLLAADREPTRRPQALLDQAQEVAVEVIDGDPVVADRIRRDSEFRAMGYVLRARGESGS